MVKALYFLIFVSFCSTANLTDNLKEQPDFSRPTVKELLDSKNRTVEDHLRELEPPIELFQYQLKAINYSDGINYGEAEMITGIFNYSKAAEGCGSTGAIVDYGVYWKVTTYVGFSASNGKPLFIHKKKGYISHNGDVLYSHASKMDFHVRVSAAKKPEGSK